MSERSWLFNGYQGRTYTDLVARTPVAAPRNAAEPCLLITFDDGQISLYENAFPLMQARGLVGTSYTIAYFLHVGWGDVMNLSQTRELQEAGWAIANHTYDHTILDTVSLDVAKQKLNSGRDYLRRCGFDNASRHVAYPYGAHNADIQAMMVSEGYLTGRTIESGDMSCGTVHADTNGGLMNLACHIQLEPDTPVSTLTGWVDNALQTDTSISVLFHKIPTTASANNEWPLASFEQWLDYVVASGIRCVTIVDWYAEYVNRYGG